jgi:hypothetical protein
MAPHVAADIERQLEGIEAGLRAGRPSAVQDLARLSESLTRVGQSLEAGRAREAGDRIPMPYISSPGRIDTDSGFLGGGDQGLTGGRTLRGLGETGRRLSASRDRSAGAMAPARPSGSPAMPAALTDRVHFSVTAPPTVVPGAAFTVDVWAYIERQRAEVMERASLAARGVNIFFREKGPVTIARGKILTVHLRLDGVVVDDPEDTLLWEGEIGTASFPVRVSDDAAPGSRPGQVAFYLEGLQVAKLHFTLAVGRVASEVAPIDVREERHRRAFASYAREDTDQVLDILSGMQKASPGLDVFFDRRSIRSGEIWERRLEAEILDRDVFYLFWSRAASESDWVRREWKLALTRRGLEYIDPVPLVSPEVVAPPAELGRLNFDDWVLAYKRRTGRRAAADT